MARSLNSGTITFGMVTISVKFYTSASANRVSFNLLSPAGNRVRQQYVDAITNAEVPGGMAGCDKGFEVEKDRFVHFTKDELKALDAECDSRTIDIQEFIPQSALDPVAVEKTYFLGPDKSDKAYLLLSEAMTAKKVVAVAQWNSRGKEHLVTIVPYKGGLALYQMYYATEVRDFGEVEIAVKIPISDPERRMAQKLIETLTTEEFDAAKYEDSYVARVKQAIDDKANGGTVKTAAPKAAQAGNVFDISALLEQSIAQNRKPKAKKAPKAEDPKKPGKK